MLIESDALKIPPWGQGLRNGDDEHSAYTILYGVSHSLPLPTLCFKKVCLKFPKVSLVRYVQYTKQPRREIKPPFAGIFVIHSFVYQKLPESDNYC